MDHMSGHLMGILFNKGDDVLDEFEYRETEAAKTIPYRDYVLAEFNKCWQVLYADDWYTIMTEVMYTEDLAQVVRACEEY